MKCREHVGGTPLSLNREDRPTVLSSFADGPTESGRSLIFGGITSQKFYNQWEVLQRKGRALRLSISENAF